MGNRRQQSRPKAFTRLPCNLIEAFLGKSGAINGNGYLLDYRVKRLFIRCVQI